MAKRKSFSGKQFQAEIKKITLGGTSDTDSKSDENKNISTKKKIGKNKRAGTIFWYCYV